MEVMGDLYKGQHLIGVHLREDGIRVSMNKSLEGFSVRGRREWGVSWRGEVGMRVLLLGLIYGRNNICMLMERSRREENVANEEK